MKIKEDAYKVLDSALLRHRSIKAYVTYTGINYITFVFLSSLSFIVQYYKEEAGVTRYLKRYHHSGTQVILGNYDYDDFWQKSVNNVMKKVEEFQENGKYFLILFNISQFHFRFKLEV